MNNVFINVLDGDDDTEFNKIQDKLTTLYESAVIKYSDDLMKDKTINVGTFTMGISPVDKDKVSAFLSVIVKYNGGKAIWFDSTDNYYRFSSKTCNESIENWLLFALYNKLRYPKSQMYKLIQEKFFPEWEQKHDTEGVRFSRYIEHEKDYLSIWVDNLDRRDLYVQSRK